MRDVPPFKQIAVSTGVGEEAFDVIYGLDDDGRVWSFVSHRKTEGWIPIKTDIHPRYDGSGED